MFEFDGIGTHWWIENLKGAEFDQDTKNTVLKHVQEFDNTFSRFKPTSLIGILNSKKYLMNPPQQLLDMLRFCEEMYDVSEGAFDISVGGVLHAQGYGSTKNASEIVPNFWNEVKYNRDEIRIPEGAVIDTGGYGKGWLIDELIDLLTRRGYFDVLVNGGGDIRVVGDLQIELAIEHPLDSTQKVGSTRLKNSALAASGTAKRSWEFGGNVYNHIVDPKSGESLKNNVAGAYVKAPIALLADTLATIVLIRPELASKLEDHYHAQIVTLNYRQLA